MCLRRHRLPAPPCSWSRPTCLLTSPLASQPTCVPTLEARLSHSACLTTGRSFQAVPFLMAPSPTRCTLDLLQLLDKMVKVNKWSIMWFLKLVDNVQAHDLRHYSLFSLTSSKLTLFILFLIFETLFIIIVKLRHYLNEFDII